MLGSSPTFLFEVTAPASDIAATAWWSLALFALMFEPRRAALGAGMATGMAILTRPNVAPLALVLATPTIVRIVRASSAEERRHALMRLLWFAVGVLPACAFIGLLNRELYGSPLSSGYGSLSDLYAWSHAWANLSHYPRWLVETQTPVVVLAIAAPFVVSRSTAVMWLSGIVAIFGLYVFYLPFDELVVPALPHADVSGALRPDERRPLPRCRGWAGRSGRSGGRGAHLAHREPGPRPRRGHGVGRPNSATPRRARTLPRHFRSARRCCRCSTAAALASTPAASRCGTTSLDGTTSIVCSAI